MKENKEDKGFELYYANLSYKGKFIRTLWMLPFAIAVIVLLFIISENKIRNIAISIIMCVTFIIQLIYNYIKWREDERSQE